MMRITQQYNRRQGGSAMILVVVITVLLAVIGVMFVMVARVGEMGSSAVVDSTDLDVAVETVVSRIHAVLVEDLFDEDGVIGADGPHYTWPGVARGDNPLTGERIVPWLADLEPNSLNSFHWEHITDLLAPDNPTAFVGTLPPDIIPDNPKTVVPGTAADAAGDGVADSIWIRLPNASTSRGKPVFAAIRIIDNCAMLNLNTAHCFYQNPTSIDSFQEPWYPNRNLFLNEPILGKYSAEGRYITDVNYRHFLRGADLIGPSSPFDQNWYNIMRAKGFFNWVSNTPYSPEQAHNVVLNFIDAPVSNYGFFDIGDELEIRNRYKISSRVEARFERPDIANYTLDAGGGLYAPLRTPVEDDEALEDWKRRLNPANFEGLGDPPPSHPYYYDRRHISTFYSFDRPLRSGQYPLLEADVPDAVQRAVFVPDKAMPIDLRTADITDATTIVQLLYALREVYDAQKAAQIVANLIDYVDTNHAVTVLNTDRIAQYIVNAAGGLFSTAKADAIAVNFGLATDDVIYGYERQPFISEIYTQISSFGVVERFAIELLNPYDADIDISGWEIVFTSTAGVETAYSVPSGAVLSANRGRRVLCSEITISGTPCSLMTELKSLTNQTQSVELRRPTVAEPLAVDRISREIILQMVTNPSTNSVHNSSKRDDRDWRIASAHFTTPTQTAAYSGSLGTDNNVTIDDASNYQLPVANDDQPIERLADFIQVSFLSSTGGDDPNTITELIADAADEADIRYDLEAAPELLDYICFLNRPDIGSLPGRININTAALHVIAAAIPPQLVMTDLTEPSALKFAQAIVNNRPYQRVSDLLEIEIFKQYKDHSTINVGDQGIRGDFEERDWIVSRLANIFTVRSDTFTAYILVRLGDDGPQRRMIAIFDRSQVWTPSDHPRLVALHPVPEAR